MGLGGTGGWVTCGTGEVGWARGVGRAWRGGGVGSGGTRGWVTCGTDEVGWGRVGWDRVGLGWGRIGWNKASAGRR